MVGAADGALTTPLATLPGGFLTGPQARDTLALTLRYLQQNN